MTTTAKTPIDSGKAAAIYCFVVNEFNLILLALFVLARRKVCVLGENPLLPGGGALVRKAVAWLEGRGAIIDVREIAPETKRFWVSRAPEHMGNYFDWIEDGYDRIPTEFGFSRLDRRVGVYSNAIKAAIGNHYFKFIYLIYMIPDLERRAEGQRFVLIGLDEEIRRFFRIYWRRDPRLDHIRTPQFRFIINACLWFGSVLTILALIGRKFRPTGGPVRMVDLAVDWMGRDLPTRKFVDDVVDGKQERLLFVARNREAFEGQEDFLGDRALCLRTDGVIDPAMLARCLWIALVDTTRLLSAVGARSSVVMRGSLGFVYWRIVYAALFRRYRPKHFFCRDEYTPEHHMRSRELRRVGGRTVGFVHGIDWAACHAGYSYMDFDQIFLFGETSPRAFQRALWPKDMRVRTVGTFRLSRQEIEAFPKQRPNNILILFSESPGGLEMLDCTWEIAKAFPDRRVHVRSKRPAYPENPELDALFRKLREDLPPNVEIQPDRSFSILHKVDFIIGSATTMICEGMQFGLHGFVLDAGFSGHPEPWVMHFREFPFMCVDTAAEFVDRVRSIEDGTWRYPIEEAAPLVELYCPNLYDTIQAELGIVRSA